MVKQVGVLVECATAVAFVALLLQMALRMVLQLAAEVKRLTTLVAEVGLINVVNSLVRLQRVHVVEGQSTESALVVGEAVLVLNRIRPRHSSRAHISIFFF